MSSNLKSHNLNLRMIKLKLAELNPKNLRDDLYMIFREQHPGKRFLIKITIFNSGPRMSGVDKYDWTRREFKGSGKTWTSYVLLKNCLTFTGIMKGIDCIFQNQFILN